jgi:hypothetical protein
MPWQSNSDKGHREDMRFVIILAAISAAVVLGAKHLGVIGTQSDIDKYSLSTVENTPIPNAVALNLWREKAQAFCRNASPNDFEVTGRTPEQCESDVIQKHSACADALAPEYPDTINNKTDLKHMGKAYFGCALPKPKLG